MEALQRKPGEELKEEDYVEVTDAVVAEDADAEVSVEEQYDVVDGNIYLDDSNEPDED